MLLLAPGVFSRTESAFKFFLLPIFRRINRSPFGILGLAADSLFLKKYMTELLAERNRIIKEFAESGRGRELLT